MHDTYVGTNSLNHDMIDTCTKFLLSRLQFLGLEPPIVDNHAISFNSVTITIFMGETGFNYCVTSIRNSFVQKYAINTINHTVHMCVWGEDASVGVSGGGMCKWRLCKYVGLGKS